MLTSLFAKKPLNSLNKATNKLSAVGVVEELFEEGSAMLAERFVVSRIPSYVFAIVKVCVRNTHKSKRRVTLF